MAEVDSHNALSAIDSRTENNQQGQANSNSYFSAKPGESAIDDRPGSPVEAVKGVKSGKELLRRLSLVDQVKPEVLDIDPSAVHPGLNLSGRVISAAICIPYKLGHRAGADWVRTSLETPHVLS